MLKNVGLFCTPRMNHALLKQPEYWVRSSSLLAEQFLSLMSHGNVFDARWYRECKETRERRAKTGKEKDVYIGTT